jgi:hypothetical protein
MLPTNRILPHPREVLRDQFGIIGLDGDVDAEDAQAFADATGTTPEFWMNLQANHNATKARA